MTSIPFLVLVPKDDINNAIKYFTRRKQQSFRMLEIVEKVRYSRMFAEI
jgi:hypothetical protein